MNERIKELAEQAGYTPLPGFDFANDLQEVFLKKFAELIVKECVAVAVEQKKWVQNQQATFNYDDDRWDRARIQQSDRIIGKIREHFEIEE